MARHLASIQDLRIIGSCEVEKTYEGPKLETTDDGKYKITIEFIRSMMQWFKDAKALPRRYAWEIVLGAHNHFVKEESLVDVKVENDVTIDVIGDVHGAFYYPSTLGRSSD